MSEVIIACRMIENEVEQALSRTGNTSRVIYLDQDLHEFPDRLKKKIQGILSNTFEECVLLAYGLCGNAMNSVFSPHSTVVIPRFHDCIHMMLVTENKTHPNTCPNHLYCTEGWLDSDNTLLKEYERFAKRRGESRARLVYYQMLHNYSHLCLVNTGREFRASTIELAWKTGELFGLDIREEKGSTCVLRRLFAREWDEDFLICPPGSPIMQSDFYRKDLQDCGSRR